MDAIASKFQQLSATNPNASAIDLLTQVATSLPTEVTLNRSHQEVSLLKGRRTYAGPQAITLATTALTTHRAYEHEVEDKEVEKILTRLQAFGYELQIIERPCVSGYTYMVTYFFAFAIGGFGKCSGFSERSLADAWQKAAVKLKQRYTEHFGGVDEERLLRAVAWKHDHLYPVDLTVVELLKQFHKAYTPTGTPTTILEPLLESNHIRLTSRRIIDPDRSDNSQITQCCLYLANQSLVCTSLKEAKARERCLREGYQLLRAISQVLSTFGDINSPEKSPSEVIRQLRQVHPSELPLRLTNSRRAEPNVVNGALSLASLITFRSVATNEADASEAVFRALFNYLAALADLLAAGQPRRPTTSRRPVVIVEDVPPPATIEEQLMQMSNKDLQETYQKMLDPLGWPGGVFRMGREHPRMARRMANLVQLVDRFTKACSATASSIEAIETLITQNHFKVDITTSGQQHLTTLSSPYLGDFTGASSDVVQSRTMAINQAGHLLAALSRLFASHITLRQTPLEAYTRLMIDLNGDLLALSTIPMGPKTFTIYLEISSLYFRVREHGSKMSRLEVEGLVLRRVATFLDQLIGDGRFELTGAPLNAGTTFQAPGPIDGALRRAILHRNVPLQVPPRPPQPVDPHGGDLLTLFELLHLWDVTPKPIGGDHAETMEKIIAKRRELFDCETNKKWMPRERHSFNRAQWKVTINVATIGSFTGIKKPVEVAREFVLEALYDRFRRLSTLIRDLKEVAPITSIAAMQDILLEHRFMFKTQTWPIRMRPYKVRMAINVINLGSYWAIGDSDEEASRGALAMFCHQVLPISEYVQVKMDQEQLDRLTEWTSALAIELADWPVAPIDEHLALRIRLLRNFDWVNRDPDLTDLNFWHIFRTSLGPGAPDLHNIGRVPGHPGWTITLTLTDVGHFTASHIDERIAWILVIQQMRRFFGHLSQLVEDFQTVYTPTTPPATILNTLLARPTARAMLKLHQTVVNQLPEAERHLAVVEINRLNTWARVGRTEVEALERVAGATVHYLYQLAVATRGVRPN